MDPGEETNLWSSCEENDAKEGEYWYGPVQETYFCIRGRLRLEWDEGVLEFGPMDSIYLAPGWHYRLRNIGDEQAFFVYSMYPSPD